jgi:DNA-binding MarR family transcriptional regulator
MRHDPKARTFYRFAISAEYYARWLAAMYRPAYRLSPPEWKVLAILAAHAPMSATEAGQRTSLKPDKVTRAVDSLVAKRLVLRRLDKDDKRRVVLSLSAKGARAFGDIDRVRYAVESEMLQNLEPAEIEALHRIMDKIERQVREMLDAGDTWKQILARTRRSASAPDDPARSTGRRTTP